MTMLNKENLFKLFKDLGWTQHGNIWVSPSSPKSGPLSSDGQFGPLKRILYWEENDSDIDSVLKELISRKL